MINTQLFGQLAKTDRSIAIGKRERAVWIAYNTKFAKWLAKYMKTYEDTRIGIV